MFPRVPPATGSSAGTGASPSKAVAPEAGAAGAASHPQVSKGWRFPLKTIVFFCLILQFSGEIAIPETG
jgi:hypothetical protein